MNNKGIKSIPIRPECLGMGLEVRDSQIVSDPWMGEGVQYAIRRPQNFSGRFLKS